MGGLHLIIGRTKTGFLEKKEFCLETVTEILPTCPTNFRVQTEIATLACISRLLACPTDFRFASTYVSKFIKLCTLYMCNFLCQLYLKKYSESQRAFVYVVLLICLLISTELGITLKILKNI